MQTVRPAWTGELLGQMHCAGITQQQIGEKLGLCKGYMAMIFNGQRSPKGIEEKCRAAFTELVLEKTDKE